ncbi:ABC transporter ATP-binding protein [Metabacillus litoralis]|uniref:ABC transporter ATP-binding protein n=1 Tax=Metabacillus litoralis TaxID=152268 RepID=UPI0020409716|nr:ABC transporter ATP-binding protein [Metabacillus litoralis]MCM3652967.1 ABC transporter ATP-binding protein [Metabacillus litoralis]
MKTKVVFSHVSKTYKLYKKNSDKLLDLFSISKKRTKMFYALSDISFEVYEGETIGIIGTNGSGKSTLSNLLSESVPHTSGTIKINGEPSLIAIAAGLDKNLSGMDNIKQKCLMHGMKSQEIEKIKDDIIEFADLGDFIDQPVKNYSSGMKSRLGFAISVHTNPDILIIDEALSVGDQTFYQKCLDKIDEFKKQGKTIFFVSHSVGQVRSISDRVMWVHFGRMKEFGDTKTVLKNYKEFITWFNALTENEKKQYRAEMMEKQTIYSTSEIEENDNLEIKSRSPQKKKAKKNVSIGFLIQMVLLLTLTIFSGFLMFTDFSLSTFAKQKETDSILNKEAIHASVINQEGIIVTEQASAYKSQDQDANVQSIPFAARVFVEEKLGNNYKVRYKNDSYYLDMNDIQLTSKTDLQVTNRTIEDYLTILPESFYQSYEFFFAFFNEDYETVTSKIRGYQEGTNKEGNKVLTLNGYGLSYIFNKDNLVEKILIYNINQNSQSLQSFMNQAQVSSDDQNHFLQVTKDYEMILNLEKSTLSVKRNVE